MNYYSAFGPSEPLKARGKSARDRLFSERYGAASSGLPNYDVSKDGQRF